MRLSFKRSVAVATLLMMTYAVLRAALVWGTINDYGVNPWVFLILDVVTSPPYVWGIGMMVQGLRGVSRLRTVYLGGIVAIIAFLVPYVYLFVAGHAAMPKITKVVIGIIVVVLFGAGPLREVIKKVKVGKACYE